MLRLNWRCMAIRCAKKPAVGSLQKMRSYRQQMQVTKKQNQNRVVPVTMGHVMIPVDR